MKYNLPSLLINRHAHIFFHYLTAKKIGNIFNILLDYLNGSSEHWFFPIYAKIETTNKCNLACSYCRDGQKNKTKQFLKFETYKGIVDELKDYLIEISLFDEGEPLLDPRIIEYIKYAHMNNIGTVISTNFSLNLSQAKIDELVLSGLDYIQIAVDGVTQATYEKYRKNGDLGLVLANLKNLVSARTRLNSNKPVIEWQMIDFDFNRHEQKDARKMAAELGADRFNLKADSYGTYPPADYRRRKKCILPWSSFSVACDGGVSACFIKDDDSLNMGNLNDRTIKEIWHSQKFKKIRSAHLSNSGTGYYCLHCNRLDGKYGEAAESKKNFEQHWRE